MKKLNRNLALVLLENKVKAKLRENMLLTEDEEDFQNWLMNHEVREEDFEDTINYYKKLYDHLFNNPENLAKDKSKWIIFKVEDKYLGNAETNNTVNATFVDKNGKYEIKDLEVVTKGKNPVFKAKRVALDDIVGRDGKTVLQAKGTEKEEKNLSLSKLNSLIDKGDLIVQGEFNPEKLKTATDEWYIKITRDIREITHMSTDKGWTSCMRLSGKNSNGSVNRNVQTGYNYMMLNAIKNGLLVAYAYRASLDEINNSTEQFAEGASARISINPYSTKEGEFLYLKAMETYGTVPFNLQRVTQDYLDENYNKGVLDLDEVFYSNQSFYNDLAIGEINPLRGSERRNAEHGQYRDEDSDYYWDEDYIEGDEFDSPYDYIMAVGGIGEYSEADLFNEISIGQWREILDNYPELASDFPISEIVYADDLSNIISELPEVLDNIDFDYIGNYHPDVLRDMLNIDLNYATMFDWGYLDEDDLMNAIDDNSVEMIEALNEGKLDDLSPETLLKIYNKYPEDIDLSGLDSASWANLIANEDDGAVLADAYNSWDELSATDWNRILLEGGNKLYTTDILEHLDERPEIWNFFNWVNIVGRLNRYGVDMDKILGTYQKYGDFKSLDRDVNRLFRLDMLNKHAIHSLMQTVVDNNMINLLNGGSWDKILQTDARFLPLATIYNALDKIDDITWVSMLLNSNDEKLISLAEENDVFNRLETYQWKPILIDKPELIKYLPKGKAVTISLDGLKDIADKNPDAIPYIDDYVKDKFKLGNYTTIENI